MKNFEIVAIVNAFTEQKSNGHGITLPAKVAWTRRVNLDKLFKAKQLIDEALKEVSEKYADDEHSEEKDGKRMVRPAFFDDFVREQSEILTQETEVDIRKVGIDDLGDVTLSDADMDTIAFMLKEDE